MGLDLEELIDEENDPGWVTVVSGVLPPASSIHWRRWRCRGAATVFATTTACSSRTSWMAVRKSPRTTGWSTVTRGSSSATTRATRCVLAGVFSRKVKSRWVETEEIPAVAYDQIIPGYDTDATNTLRLWNAQASSEINRVNSTGRLLRGGGR